MRISASTAAANNTNMNSSAQAFLSELRKVVCKIHHFEYKIPRFESTTPLVLNTKFIILLTSMIKAILLNSSGNSNLFRNDMIHITK